MVYKQWLRFVHFISFFRVCIGYDVHMRMLFPEEERYMIIVVAQIITHYIVYIDL